MDSSITQEQTAFCTQLQGQIEDCIPGVKVRNIGTTLILIFDNKSCATVYPVTAKTGDVVVRDFADREISRQDLDMQTLLTFVQQIGSLQEQTTTGAIAGYSPAKAFSSTTTGKASNRGVEASERMGFQVIEGSRGSRLTHPFGEDSLGANERNPKEKSRSEGKKKSAISHPFENGSPLSLGESTAENENQTLAYLAEMLPLDSAEINGGKLVGTIDSASMIISVQANGNFALETFVAGEKIHETDNLPASEIIRLTFQVCGHVQSKTAEQEAAQDGNEVESNDVWNVIRELAKEKGEATDPLRNKDLFSLRQGLCVDRSQSTGSNEPPGSHPLATVKGSMSHNGKPVSLNENRDASKPYSSPVQKVLRYVPGVGAILVDKSELPPTKKLAWSKEHGVHLTESKNDMTRNDRNGMWKFSGNR